MADRALAGLCATCARVRLVQSSRGATFYMCEQATRDPSLPKYPTIPVLVCTAYRLAQQAVSGTDRGTADASPRD